MTFQDLGLDTPILTALMEQGYTHPTPIQEKAVPPALAGRDVLGCAQTGTGKTCAFATPILQRLGSAQGNSRAVRALILTPTRELAIQIDDCFRDYGTHMNLRHVVVFGGVGQNPQVDALRRGTDILIATPGRLMDLYNQGYITLDQLEIFVLDEADRMLDMGFIHDVRKILRWLPQEKQTMLFSATMPPEISDLVSSLLKNPVRVAVDPISSPVEAIDQTVYLVDKNNKIRLLARLIGELRVKNALVFTRTKFGANRVARDLERMGIHAAAIHGNKSQTARQQALADFKDGGLRCLVATDIAARGLDIEELSHVFNFNLPDVPETYVHRIGRTGRAGRGGVAVSFCDSSELTMLKDIETLIGRPIPRVEDHPYPMQNTEPPARDKHGRVINEDDAEARAAAREQRRERDEARKAAAKEKRQDTAAAAARAEQVLRPAPPEPEPEPSKKNRKKKKSPEKEPDQQKESAPAPEKADAGRGRKARTGEKKDPEPETAPEPWPEDDVPEEEDYEPAHLWSRWSSRARQARPGEFFDTGDSMPNTEFIRPDPLAGDSIMDATARLLAPRTPPAPAPAPVPVPAEPVSRQESSRQKGQAKKQEKAKGRSGAAAKQTPPTKQPASAKQAAQGKQSPAPKQSAPAKQAAPAPDGPPTEKSGKKGRNRGARKGGSGEAQQPAPEKEAGGAPSGKRKGRSRGARRESQKPRAKDSTEQESLMKPFYMEP